MIALGVLYFVSHKLFSLWGFVSYCAFYITFSLTPHVSSPTVFPVTPESYSFASQWECTYVTLKTMADFGAIESLVHDNKLEFIRLMTLWWPLSRKTCFYTVTAHLLIAFTVNQHSAWARWRNLICRMKAWLFKSSRKSTHTIQLEKHLYCWGVGGKPEGKINK